MDIALKFNGYGCLRLYILEYKNKLYGRKV